jgi:aspartyl-tRNA(Asn)/glutamyl-tRNA(Gln) amidotransferase subunit A
MAESVQGKVVFESGSGLQRRTFLRLGLGASAALGLSSMPMLAWAADESEALIGMTLTEASRRMRAHQVSSVELTQAFLDRIRIYNPKLDAFITVMSDAAMEQAKALDAEAKAGKWRGPLHGLPIVLKDNIDTAGTRTTAASEVFDDRVPTEDAFVTERLKKAGAVILGKANMHEFAMGHTSATTYFGPVRNPWALDRTPAGSSGGCGAAVIADMCLAAVGTDTGGSVRMPAAYCSMVGLKPTYGLVSIRGIIPLTYSLDHCGPMTKTTEDAALMLNTMAAYDKYDVASVEHPAEDYTQTMKQPVKPLRVGVPRAPFFDKLDPEIEAAVNAAIEVIRGMVTSVHDVTMPATNGFATLSLNGEVEAYHEQLIRHDAGGYSISIRRALQGGVKSMDDVADEPCSEKVIDYIESNWSLIRTRKTIDDAFTDFDLLVLPTMRELQPEIADVIARDETPTPKPREPEHDNNCTPFDIWGIPAISIPCGFSSKGLPIGLMIAGPRFQEGRVLALAHAYEQATQWHTKRPVLSPMMAVPPIKTTGTAEKG